MFPEGTRSLTGELQPARSGIGLAIIKSSAPVVPVRVFGTFEAYGKGVKIPRPHRVQVKYGEPLHFAALRAAWERLAREFPETRFGQHAAVIADAPA